MIISHYIHYMCFFTPTLTPTRPTVLDAGLGGDAARRVRGLRLGTHRAARALAAVRVVGWVG